MQWQGLLESLAGSGPLAGVLAFATWKMWTRCQELEKRIEELQSKRIDDLKTILQHDDS